MLGKTSPCELVSQRLAPGCGTYTAANAANAAMRRDLSVIHIVVNKLIIVASVINLIQHQMSGGYTNKLNA
jgi:hypothetical protein